MKLRPLLKEWLRLTPCLKLLLWAQFVEPPVLAQPGRDATRQKEKAHSKSGPFLFESDGTSGRTRTGTPLLARDFESLMSTNFITLALFELLLYQCLLVRVRSEGCFKCVVSHLRLRIIRKKKGSSTGLQRINYIFFK